MCDPIERFRFVHIDTRDVDTDEVKPIIDAAFTAQDSSCCAKRWNAISRAVFNTAQALGYDVAWGDVLKRDDEDGTHFYLWRKDTIHTHTVQRILREEGGHQIHRRDLPTEVSETSDIPTTKED